MRSLWQKIPTLANRYDREVVKHNAPLCHLRFQLWISFRSFSPSRACASDPYLRDSNKLHLQTQKLASHCGDYGHGCFFPWQRVISDCIIRDHVTDSRKGQVGMKCVPIARQKNDQFLQIHKNNIREVSDTQQPEP